MWQLLLVAAGTGYLTKCLLDLVAHRDLPSVLPAEQTKHNLEDFSGLENQLQRTDEGLWLSEDDSEEEQISFKLRNTKGLQNPNHGNNSSEVCRMLGAQKGVAVAPALQRKRERSHHVQQQPGRCQLSQGSLSFGYEVGVSIMFMILSGQSEIDKLTTLRKQTEELVQELKSELDERKGHLQNSKPVNVCEGSILTTKEEKLASDDEFQTHREGVGSVVTSFEVPSQLAKSGITEEPTQKITEMAELELELQAELERMYVNICTGNPSKHQKKNSGLSELDPESLVDKVENELYIHGLPDNYDTAKDTPLTHVEITHNYSVSPFELDMRLRDLLEKQQENKIIELEMELKSTEIQLQAKERKLQCFKDHVQCLAEFSFGATSEEDSMVLETTSDGDRGRHFTIEASVKSCDKLLHMSESDGTLHWPLLPYTLEIDGLIESSAEFPKYPNCKHKMDEVCADKIKSASSEQVDSTAMVSDFREYIDETCMESVKVVSDAQSDTYSRYGEADPNWDGVSEHSVEHLFGREYEKLPKTDNSVSVVDCVTHLKSVPENFLKKDSVVDISSTSECVDKISLGTCKLGIDAKFTSDDSEGGWCCSSGYLVDATHKSHIGLNHYQALEPVPLASDDIYECNGFENAVCARRSTPTEVSKELSSYMSNNYENSGMLPRYDLPEIDPLVLDKVNRWKNWNVLPQYSGKALLK